MPRSDDVDASDPFIDAFCAGSGIAEGCGASGGRLRLALVIPCRGDGGTGSHVLLESYRIADLELELL